LISTADQALLRDEFAKMTRPVRLVFFTQTLDCETCLQTRQIVDELPPLSDRISIEEVNLVLDRDKAAQYGIARAPAIVLTYEDGGGAADRGRDPGVIKDGGGAADRGRDPGVIKDSRIRFLGAPSGYEFISLVRAVLLVGGAREPELSPENRARLAAVDKPVTMQVFTTPT
jgi:alkyl hydroperoxide reductase subunit AhpF